MHDQLSQTKYGTEESLEWWKAEDVRVYNLPSILFLRNIILIVHVVPCKVIPQHTCLKTSTWHTVSPKIHLPRGFPTFFPKQLGICNQVFTHLLYVPIYTRLQIFIPLSPAVTKSCHIKCEHPATPARVSADGGHFAHICELGGRV